MGNCVPKAEHQEASALSEGKCRIQITRQVGIAARTIYQQRDVGMMTSNDIKGLQRYFGTRTNKACPDLIPSVSCLALASWSCEEHASN